MHDTSSLVLVSVSLQALLESIAESSSSSSSSDSDTAGAGTASNGADSSSLPVNSSSSSPGEHWEAGCVVNVNFPSAAVGHLAGLALTHQGTGCVFPKFLEIAEPTGPHLAGVLSATAHGEYHWRLGVYTWTTSWSGWGLMFALAKRGTMLSVRPAVSFFEVGCAQHVAAA